MILYLTAVIVIAAAALVAVLNVRALQDTCPRPGLRRRLAVLLLDLWDWARSGAAFLPPAPHVPPIVTDREVRREFRRRPLVPMSPDPAARPFPGWQVPADYPPRRVNGQDLGPQPRRSPAVRPAVRPGHPPWVTAEMPAVTGFRRSDAELDGIEWERQPGADTLGRVLAGLRALDVDPAVAERVAGVLQA